MPANLVPDEDLNVRPLSPLERSWCDQMEQLMQSCPKRLALVDVAGAMLVVDQLAHSMSCNVAQMVVAGIPAGTGHLLTVDSNLELRKQTV